MCVEMIQKKRMPLLSVSKQNSPHLNALKKSTVKNFADVVESFSYGENIDMELREVGVPTNSDGVILEVQNVFQLNEQMLNTFRYVLKRDEVSNLEHKINFEDNTVTYTIYFLDVQTDKKIESYMSLVVFLQSPFLYFALLCLWNPQRYLFFL